MPLLNQCTCTCSGLRQLTRRITGIYDHYLSADGLTISQYTLLARIGKYGPVGVIPLAAGMGMDRSTMSRSLKPLITAKWVAMLDLPLDMLTDKRSFGVQLTDDGRYKWESAMPAWNNAQERIADLLGEETHQNLVQIIARSNVLLDQF